MSKLYCTSGPYPFSTGPAASSAAERTLDCRRSAVGTERSGSDDRVFRERMVVKPVVSNMR
jgi:hypothetical protein